MPFVDQLFPEEVKALEHLKSICPLCEKYEDEFLISCLFVSKMDFPKAVGRIEKNWKVFSAP